MGGGSWIGEPVGGTGITGGIRSGLMTIAACSSGMSIADADNAPETNNSKAMQIARMGFSPQRINDA
jgi:hypothetical protein